MNTNKEWLDYYDTIAEEVDDEILDQADEKFNIGIDDGQGLDIPEDYYIFVAKTHFMSV